MPVAERIQELLKDLAAKEKSLRTLGTEAMLNEAAVCAAKIAELCLKYKIEMPEEERARANRNAIDREVYIYDGTEGYRARSRQAWEINLASTVARVHDTRCLVGQGYLVFVGREPDRAVAMAVFRILRRELTEACTYGYRQARKSGLTTRGFIASFFTGATSMIFQRYRDMKEGVVTANLAQALVRQTEEELNQWVAESGVRRSRYKQRGGYSPLGYAEGARFGDTVSLGGQAIEGEVIEPGGS